MRLEQEAGRDVGGAGYPVPLGPYVLLHRLATGGMGEVHLAKHGGLAGLEKYCVIKTLRRGALSDAESVRRFVDEGRVVLNLSHRNICSVFDVGCADGRYYLAMEHIAGRDLKGVLARARERGLPFSPALALHLMGDVLEALDYAHRFRDPASGAPLNLVHRDVSPANVMVGLEGEVKLIDFGLAWSSVKQQLTEPNVVIGKVAYMAPEQLSGTALDARADVFAAGVLLYELLSGERYYGDLRQGDIVRAATSGRFLPPKLTILDDELQRILRRALAYERAQRFDSCAVLREALVRYAARRRLAASTRQLCALMQALFPDERERLRALLAHLASPRADGSRGGLPCPPPTDVGAAMPANFDTFEDFEVSEPSTPVGRLKLAKARADVVKPGTPRPELLERLGLPSGPSTRAPGMAPSGPHPRALPRPAPLSLPPETPPPTPVHLERRRLPIALAAVGSFVAAAVLALALLPTTTDVPSTKTTATSPARAPSTAPPSPPAAVPARSRPVLDVERDAAVAAEPMKRRPLRAPDADARPEEKLRTLESACRKKLPCAAELVSAFRGMRVDDARRFWAEVDACLRKCTP